MIVPPLFIRRTDLYLSSLLLRITYFCTHIIRCNMFLYRPCIQYLKYPIAGSPSKYFVYVLNSHPYMACLSFQLIDIHQSSIHLRCTLQHDVFNSLSPLSFSTYIISKFWNIWASLSPMSKSLYIFIFLVTREHRVNFGRPAVLFDSFKYYLRLLLLV